ncbi:hypothetical protein AB0I28_12740 [Phytomonospora sp. NPDC050363]|uniref:hypothetical protein n=1 Tax=Phytomonospora sp. NPDC050363 TaxID=3155642 RepID=UPI0033FC7E12
MMSDLTPEQAAVDVAARWYTSTDGVSEQDWRDAALEIADAVIDAARPQIEAEALRDAADRWPMAWPIQGHDWLRERARLAGGEEHHA